MTLRALEIIVIGECNLHYTLLQQAIEQDKNIVITRNELDSKKMLSQLPLKRIPDVFIVIKSDNHCTQKLTDSLHRYHPEVPIIILGKDKEDEFDLVNKKVFAHLVPEQCKDYITAIRIVAEKQHFTTQRYWDRHDLVMSHEQSGKAIDEMGKLQPELMAVARAIYEHPDATYIELGRDVLHLSDDRAFYKTRKLWQLLGFSGKRELTVFLLQFFSKNE